MSGESLLPGEMVLNVSPLRQESELLLCASPIRRTLSAPPCRYNGNSIERIPDCTLMNLNQLLSLIELGKADSLQFNLDSESRKCRLTLHCQGQDTDSDGLEIALDSIRESDEFMSEIAAYAEAVSGKACSEIGIDLQLAPIVDYMTAAGAADLTMRREGDSVVIVRLAKEVEGQVVAYHFAMTSDTMRGTDDASLSAKDRAMYDLSVAFRKTLFEAQQKVPHMSFGFEGELVLAGGPILCLGGPKDGERVADAGPFLRLATLGQVYEKRWYRFTGIDRPFYVHSGTSEAAASTMARAVMTGTTR
jgi:hypothetical protein